MEGKPKAEVADRVSYQLSFVSIVTKKSLRTDYDKTEGDMMSMATDVKQMMEYHTQLTNIIEHANSIKMS